MHYFIYPTGRNGLVLADIIRFFEPDSCVSFIDDGDEKRSLKSLKHEIQENPVLIASKKFQKELENSLKREGIKNFCDGIALFGEKNQNYLIEHLKNPRKTVAIVLSGFSKEKHLGDVDRELKALGVEILYIATSKKALEQNKDRIGTSTCIIAWHDFLTEIKEVALLVTTNGGKTHHSVKSINLGHSLRHFSQLHFHFPNETEYVEVIRDWYLRQNDYLVLSNTVDFAWFTKLAQKYHARTKIIQNGYLGFDEIKTTKNKNATLKKVLLAPKQIDDKEAFYDLIETILKQTSFSVVLRFCPFERILEIEEEAMRRFGNSGRFFVDGTPKFEQELKQECLSVITDFSTLAYSFPFSMLRPAIILGVSDKESVEGVRFLEEDIHRYATSPLEVVNALKEIADNLTTWRKKIEAYRENNLYPRIDSSKNLAQTIIKILNKEL